MLSKFLNLNQNSEINLSYFNKEFKGMCPSVTLFDPEVVMMTLFVRSPCHSIMINIAILDRLTDRGVKCRVTCVKVKVSHGKLYT